MSGMLINTSITESAPVTIRLLSPEQYTQLELVVFWLKNTVNLIRQSIMMVEEAIQGTKDQSHLQEVEVEIRASMQRYSDLSQEHSALLFQLEESLDVLETFALAEVVALRRGSPPHDRIGLDVVMPQGARRQLLKAIEYFYWNLQHQSETEKLTRILVKWHVLARQ